MTPTIIVIEGNIGSGKSSFLKKLQEECFQKDRTHIVTLQEPVELWENLMNHKGQSILSKFYQNPQKYAFPLQIYILQTLHLQLQNAMEQNPEATIFVCERSVESSRYIFSQMLYDKKHMNSLEMQIYNSIYDTLYKDKYKISKIIYLDTPPEICLTRIQTRDRLAEKNISIEYLLQCEIYYQNFIQRMKEQIGHSNVIIHYT